MSTLVFSPAMAQEAEEVHEQALKVLREQLANPPTNTLSRPSISESRRIEGEIQRDRTERNMLLREQAEAERARRQQLHDEKRQEFEQEMREREFIRQRQRDYDESVSRQMRALNPGMATEDVHSQALSVLRGTEAAPAPQNAQAAPPTSAVPTQIPAPATTANVAPAVAPQENVVNQEELHQRALEILRSNQQPVPQETTPAPVAVTPAPRPEPAPVTPAPAAVSAQPAAAQPHITEVHDQALQVLRQQQAQSPAPAPAPKPSPELLQRLQQDQIARSTTRPRPAAVPPANTTPPPAARPAPAPSPAPAPATLPPDQEERAREILRQQQAQIAAAPVSPQPMARTTPPAAAPANTQANEQYSRELEEKARQILAERAQAQPSATTPAATPAPAPRPAPVTPPPAATAPAVSQPAATAAPQAAPAEDVHARALEALRQGGGPTGPQPVRTKREKLRELTDMYKADKITSAEYHQQRAKILAEPGE